MARLRHEHTNKKLLGKTAGLDKSEDPHLQAEVWLKSNDPNYETKPKRKRKRSKNRKKLVGALEEQYNDWKNKNG